MNQDSYSHKTEVQLCKSVIIRNVQIVSTAEPAVLCLCQLPGGTNSKTLCTESASSLQQHVYGHLQLASLMYLKLIFPFNEHLCSLSEYPGLIVLFKRHN